VKDATKTPVTRTKRNQPNPAAVLSVRNPLPALGGTEPEPLDQVRQQAPLAPRRVRLRAVTAEDYAELAAALPGVRRAAAEIRWTGAGQEAHVAIEPTAGDTPSQRLLAGVRRALRDHRRIGHDLTVGGADIPAGDALILAPQAANRDPRVFPGPGDFDITRTANPHVTFGHGIHYCVGASLARVELQEAFGRIPSRLPGLRLDVPREELRWRAESLTGGLDALPVRW